MTELSQDTVAYIKENAEPSDESNVFSVTTEDTSIIKFFKDWMNDVFEACHSKGLHATSYKRNISEFEGCWPVEEKIDESNPKLVTFNVLFDNIERTGGTYLLDWPNLEVVMGSYGGPNTKLRQAAKYPIKDSDLDQYNFGIYGRDIKHNNSIVKIVFQTPIRGDTKRIAQDSDVAIINGDYWYVDGLETALTIFNDFLEGKQLSRCDGTIGK